MTDAATSGQVSRQAFPGTPQHAREARRWLLAQLGADHPDADRVERIAAELFANALFHTRSGAEDGEVRVALHRADTVRLSVYDQGGDSVPEAREARLDASSGRGLAIVAAEADAWGTEQTPDGLEVWAEVRP